MFCVLYRRTIFHKPLDIFWYAKQLEALTRSRVRHHIMCSPIVYPLHSQVSTRAFFDSFVMMSIVYFVDLRKRSRPAR